jgi:transcription initiation factor TFIIE subunit alpha
MDLAVTLVKSVMRAFYTPREIVVIDALILHETYASPMALTLRQ